MGINVEVKKCVLHPLEYPGCVFATCIYSMSQIDTNILWRQMEHQFISGHPAFLFTLLELLLLLAALRSPIAAVSWANIWQSCFLLKPKQVAHHHHYINLTIDGFRFPIVKDAWWQFSLTAWPLPQVQLGHSVFRGTKLT